MKRKLIYFLTILMLLFNVNTVCANTKVDENAELIKKTMNIILEKYYGENYKEIDEDVLYEAAMNGMFSILDDYSEFYNKEELNSWLDDAEGNSYGLGVMVQKHDLGAIVQSVLKDSGAEKAGIKEGDIITHVEKKSVAGMKLEEITNLIKGKEGTTVNITISRASDKLDFTVTRTLIKENPISSCLVSELTNDERDKKSIYLYIESFNNYTTKYLIEELNKYEIDDEWNIILDLQDNPGGMLEEACSVSSFFLDKDDVIVSLVDKKGEEITYSSKSASGFNGGLVILINRNTASASEVVTAALRENNKAIVVGDSTYGKNCAQQTYSDGDKINYKLTMKTYTTPKGNSLIKNGFKPDYLFETPKLIYDVKYKYYGGEESEDVLAVKSMLKYLGYKVSDFSNKYDESTKKLVSEFQKANGLCPEGILDYTTQRKFNTVVYNKYMEDDSAFNKAVEVIRNFKEESKKFFK